MTDIDTITRLHKEQRLLYLKDQVKHYSKSLLLLGIVIVWWWGVFYVLGDRLDK